ncbi:DUF6263 family protein [Ichthyenterobacterium sp. W332]|uniref:DUF6263 family protein n=1 Tax=Microcosmobacter mediterraneus TaxID=3075607 RepID=A0ABU2YHS7_9FLAO|nr:DUF6263 family protein [Ichthyenterobacterium sp. W332]MDT0557249.1 DUF6263 family protein [Ichthyenterobacterium sp. W332]
MKTITTSLLLCIVLMCNTIHAQSVLQYNLSLGDTYTIQQSAEQDITQDMNGSKHDMRNEINASYIFTVKAVNDSLITMDFRFDSFKMKSTSNLMGELISVNTKDSISDDDIEGKIFSGLTKSTLTMTMYKNGKIKELSGTEELIMKMVEGAGDFDEFTKELMKESMKGEFGNESLVESFEQMTYIYSKDKVSIGDTWTNRFRGDLSAENVWTLMSMDDTKNTISGKSDVMFNTEEDTITMKLSGTMDSNLSVNSNTGFIDEMTTSSTAKGISVLKQMNNLEVPTTIISNVSYKITKNVQ